MVTLLQQVHHCCCADTARCKRKAEARAFKVGQTGRIFAIRPEREAVLAYLHERDLIPGQEITVIESAPLQGPLTLNLGKVEVVLGLNLAALILMEEEGIS